MFPTAALAEPALIEVRFEVRLPQGTPDGAIYVAGNHEAIGGWRADGLRLERVSRDLATGTAMVPAGTALEYKFTRGSWETVEKMTDGSERANRTLIHWFNNNGAIQIAANEAVEAWADSAPPRPRTLTGDIRFHEKFRSRHLANERTIAVYLPPGYDSSPRRRYPVLYMHDGQNIFDASTSFIGAEWGVDEACEKLITDGTIAPVIVVGVYNNDRRIDEYTPAPSTDTRHSGGGRGDLYGRFLIDEVKPFIDRTYRTRPTRRYTTVMGSSLGGLISLHLAWTRPDIFGAAGVVSPSLWWSGREIMKRIERARRAPSPRPKLWIDMGTREGDSLESYRNSVAEVEKLSTLLQRKGWREGTTLKTFIHEGADHSERAWNARIETILEFLYGKPAAGRTDAR
jgi:predicted alpha/beta superfamily hydrolase